MKIEKKSICIVIVVIAFGLHNKSNCQENIDSSPLVKFFRLNTDTTIIFYYPPSLWVKYTDQLIISKQGNSLLYSSYVNPYKHYSLGYKLPEDEMGKKFTAEERIFEKTVPDTNRYFLPKDVKQPLRDSAWREIIKLKPWALKDTISTEMENKHWVFDDGAMCLLFITREKVEVITFYEPGDIQKYEPGKANRKKALKIEKIFESVFEAK